MTIMSREITSGGTVVGWMAPAIPTTARVLKRLEPITFPSARSCSPLRTAMSEVTYGPENRAIWKDPAEIAPAFVHLALQGPDGIHDRHVRAWDLVVELREGAA